MGAEHQGYLGTTDPNTGEEYDPWIRTKAVGTGSSAFGPVQLTGGSGSMMANVVGGGVDIGASPEELDWIKSRYLPSANKALEFGGADMPEGSIDPLTGKDVSMYDYGGSWDFNDQDKLMYQSVANKLIQSEFDRAGGDIDSFIEAWRGKSYDEDPEYYEHIKGQVGAGNKKDQFGYGTSK